MPAPKSSRMRHGRRGVMRVLEQIAPESPHQAICSAVRAARFRPLDSLGPTHLQAAADSWRLCRLGVVTELLSVLRELAALPSLELLVSFALDLSARPLGGIWLPDHPLRVAQLASKLATDGVRHAIARGELRWSALLTEPALEGLWMGALLHDLGKQLLPGQVRSGAVLTEEQYSQLRQHPRIGHDALCQLAWPWPEVLPIVLHHHERWDGAGYPDGLAGEDIPWAAQIVGLADFCETLATPQPYRDPLKPESIASRLESASGTVFNPILVRALLHIWREVGRSM